VRFDLTLMCNAVL